VTKNSRPSITAPELGGVDWRKSSYSGGGSGQCVEVADARSAYKAVAVRDSKDPAGPALLFAPSAFANFLAEVRAGRFDA
jgi:hypothetical protein